MLFDVNVSHCHLGDLFFFFGNVGDLFSLIILNLISGDCYVCIRSTLVVFKGYPVGN